MAAQVVAAINAAFPDSVSKTIAVNIDYGYNGIGGGLPTFMGPAPPSPGPMYHPSRAFGGMTYGPDSGYLATLHGTELVVSPRAGYPATVMNGGSNQQGAQQPINITIEVAGEEFHALIDRRADNIRVKAEKQKLGKERMFV